MKNPESKRGRPARAAAPEKSRRACEEGKPVPDAPGIVAIGGAKNRAGLG
jgi:hypothetical protein